MIKIKFKSDKYKIVRGGYSRLLDISCAKCGTHLFFYQKDGPGILKRMYVDRIFESEQYTDEKFGSLKRIPNLACSTCNMILGISYVYEKEKRIAIRLFVGSITKKIIKSR